MLDVEVVPIKQLLEFVRFDQFFIQSTLHLCVHVFFLSCLHEGGFIKVFTSVGNKWGFSLVFKQFFEVEFF